MNGKKKKIDYDDYRKSESSTLKFGDVLEIPEGTSQTFVGYKGKETLTLSKTLRVKVSTVDYNYVTVLPVDLHDFNTLFADDYSTLHGESYETIITLKDGTTVDGWEYFLK